MKKSIDDIFISNLKRKAVLPQRSVTINSTLFSKVEVKEHCLSKIDGLELSKRKIKTQTNWKSEYKRKTFEDFMLYKD